MLMPVMLISARVLIRSRNRQRIKPAQFKSVSPSNSRTSVLVIGATTLAELYIRTLTEFAQGKIHVVGVMARRDTKLGRTIVGYKVEGKSDAVLERINELLVHGIQVDRVVVMTTHRNLSESEKRSLADVETKTDISVQYIDELALGSLLDRRVRQDDVACSEESRPKFVLSNEHLDELRRRPYWRLKRALDAVFAGLLIVITAP
jgi:FlaA1/EpsC-like NDP-sugar epimerase